MENNNNQGKTLCYCLTAKYIVSTFYAKILQTKLFGAKLTFCHNMKNSK